MSTTSTGTTRPLTVLVTGATGKVDRHLVRYLLDDGHHVRALTRHVRYGCGRGHGRIVRAPQRGSTIVTALPSGSDTVPKSTLSELVSST